MMLNQWPRATDYGGRTYLMALRGGGEGRSREPRRSMGQEGAGLPDGVGKKSPRGREKKFGWCWSWFLDDDIANPRNERKSRQVRLF